MDGPEISTTPSAVERLRWLAMALGLIRVLLAQPPPVSRTAALGTALIMAVYNCLITVARRRGVRPAPLALTALVLDFLVCTAWVLLLANDRYSPAYALFIFVGIEAAVLYQKRGALLFAGAFAAAFVALDRVRAAVYGFPVDIGGLVFRASIVLLVAFSVSAIASQSQRRRRELQRQAQALRTSEQRFRTIVDTTSIGVSVADAQGRLISTNRAYEELVGYTAAELRTMCIADFTHPADLGADMQLAFEVASGMRSHGQVEKRWIRKNGEVRWVRVNASHMPIAGGMPGRVVAIVEDISERRRAERELQRSVRLQTMQFAVTRCLAEAETPEDAAPRYLRSIGDALEADAARLLLVDPESHTLMVRHTWYRNPPPRHPEQRQATVLPLGEGLLGTVWSSGRIVSVADADGEPALGNLGIAGVGGVRWAVALPIVHEGCVTGVITLNGSEVRTLEDDVVATLADIGSQIGQYVERKEVEVALAESAARLSAIAATDVLTGLPNRREFEGWLAVAQSRRFAILAIDVDNLKVVNDGYGHEAGDAALRSIATALRMGVRDCDVVVRSGGDEFAALLPDTDLEEAVRVGERLRRAMHGVALPHGQARISIGCAVGPAGADAQMVFTAADEALYRAKRRGRDRLEAELASTGSASQQVRWETLIPRLLRENGMISIFQPIVNLHSGTVIGYEALGRPSDGAHDVGVEGLFAAAARMGEGRSLDWVCRRAALLACRELPASTALFVNVGVSVLLDPLHGVDQMLMLLRWGNRLPSQVVLEITEIEAVRDLERLRAVIAEYRGHGFRFALDDVGTGHSTFEVLSVATPEFVKIAGRLTQHADEIGPRSAIRALVAFAASSGAQVVAEEIEDEATASTMRRLGVDLAQGFMWGRPAAASAWQSATDARPHDRFLTAAPTDAG
jgi:diguanylate cyclase (GGDEF)-like protein/PAS domain S-box-containing protein